MNNLKTRTSSCKYIKAKIHEHSSDVLNKLFLYIVDIWHAKRYNYKICWCNKMIINIIFCVKPVEMMKKNE